MCYSYRLSLKLFIYEKEKITLVYVFVIFLVFYCNYWRCFIMCGKHIYKPITHVMGPWLVVNISYYTITATKTPPFLCLEIIWFWTLLDDYKMKGFGAYIKCYNVVYLLTQLKVCIFACTFKKKKNFFELFIFRIIYLLNKI